MNTPHRYFADFLSDHDADAMLRIAESFGSFGTYAEEGTSEGLGENYPQRFDVGLNYVSHGLDGRGNPDTPETSLRRTNYFRETYAYGDEPRIGGITPFLQNNDLLTSAHQLGGSRFVVPAIVYANILVPGQELAIHTDVPEFRGLNRKNTPQWLLVCMHHSGLFDDYRIPILTCVSWFGHANGGAFTFYPQGRQGNRESVPAIHNTAILLDTDGIFHGVERVTKATDGLPEIGPGTRLKYGGEQRWSLQNDADVLAEYTWDDLRYSISWKGYCFADAPSHEMWQAGRDPLSISQVMERFSADFADHGLGDLSAADPDARAEALVRHYIAFPSVPVAAAS